MLIANVCPIGNLDRFNYGHHLKTILKSQTDFFDLVVLVADCKEHNLFKFIKELPDKVVLISNKETWASEKGDKFDITQIQKNKQVGFKYCEGKADIITGVHINQYVPVSSFEGLRKHFQDIINRGVPLEWLYKKYQCGKLLFKPDRRVPWVLNMTVYNPFIFSADSISWKKDGKIFKKMEASMWPDKKDIAIVDLMHEYDLKTGIEKHNFTFRQIGQRPVNEEEYKLYYNKKLSRKEINKEDKLDKYGLEILNNSKADYVCRYFEKSYKYFKDVS